MISTAQKVFWCAGAVAVALGIAVPLGAAGGGADGEGLAGARILLSNDDSVQASKPNGSDGRGLYELRKRLCEAGADVVVVGPWGQQSGRGRATAGSAQVAVGAPLAVPAEYAADCSEAPSRGQVFGVCQGSVPCVAGSASASPADSVDLALGRMLADRVGWSEPPDVVLTGTNTGANTDLAITMSGTVGAATAALEHGVAAVAVSAGSRATSVPAGHTYRAAADYATGLVGRLLADRATSQLVRERVVLNVNTPDIDPGVVPRPRWTGVGDVALDRFGYRRVGADAYSLTFGPVEPAPKPVRGSDTDVLARGELSVTAVSVNRSVDGRSDRIERLAIGED